MIASNSRGPSGAPSTLGSKSAVTFAPLEERGSSEISLNVSEQEAWSLSDNQNSDIHTSDQAVSAAWSPSQHTSTNHTNTDNVVIAVE